MRTGCRDDGSALVLAIVMTALVSAFGLVLALTTMVEREVAASYADGMRLRAAAEGAAERVRADLRAAPDWDAVLDGRTVSAGSEGAPHGVRAGPDGRPIDLDVETNLLRCGRPAPCRDAEVEATTSERPWGVNNPAWQLFAWGTLSDLLAGTGVRAPVYVLVWVGDDPAENDGQAHRDGGDPADGTAGNPGAGVIRIRARAYGTRGTRRSIELTCTRQRILAWTIE